MENDAYHEPLTFFRWFILFNGPEDTRTIWIAREAMTMYGAIRTSSYHAPPRSDVLVIHQPEQGHGKPLVLHLVQPLP